MVVCASKRSELVYIDRRSILVVVYADQWTCKTLEVKIGS